MVDVKLPTKVGNTLRRSNNVNVVPPTGWSPPHPLTILNVLKQFSESQASVWPRVISANINQVWFGLLIAHVPEELRNAHQEITFK
jgi:hypothetical protein